MKQLVQKMIEPKAVLVLILLSFSVLLPAIDGEKYKFIDYGAGFNGDFDVDTALRWGKGYMWVPGVPIFGVERQSSVGMHLSDDLMAFYFGLMAGPVVGLRFEAVEFSLSSLWGATPAYLAENKLNKKNFDLFLGNSWNFKTRILWEDVSFDVILTLSKPISSQKPTYGIAFGWGQFDY